MITSLVGKLQSDTHHIRTLHIWTKPLECSTNANFPTVQCFKAEVHNLFWVKGCIVLFLVPSRAEGNIMICTIESQISKTTKKIYLTSLFLVCSLILLISVCNKLQNFKSLNSLIKSPSFARRYLYIAAGARYNHITRSGAGTRVVHPGFKG